MAKVNGIEKKLKVLLKLQNTEPELNIKEIILK